MYKIDAVAYLESISVLAKLIAIVELAPVANQDSIVPPDQRKRVTEDLVNMEECLQPVAVIVTKGIIRKTKDAFRDKTLTFRNGAQMLVQIREVLNEELSATKLFVLDAKRSDFYQSGLPLFGAEVQQKFPSAAFEIEEGGKCFACDLPTAAAFHWIRCLEAAVRAIARCLGIPDPMSGSGRNWSNMSREIREAIEIRWPAKTGRMTGDAKLFDEIYGALAGMTNPYRNATMHLDAKYSEGEALHIFATVKGLMQKVASRMDEQGLPLA